LIKQKRFLLKMSHFSVTIFRKLGMVICYTFGKIYFCFLLQNCAFWSLPYLPSHFWSLLQNLSEILPQCLFEFWVVLFLLLVTAFSNHQHLWKLSSFHHDVNFEHHHILTLCFSFEAFPVKNSMSIYIRKSQINLMNYTDSSWSIFVEWAGFWLSGSNWLLKLFDVVGNVSIIEENSILNLLTSCWIVCRKFWNNKILSWNVLVCKLDC